MIRSWRMVPDHCSGFASLPQSRVWGTRGGWSHTAARAGERKCLRVLTIPECSLKGHGPAQPSKHCLSFLPALALPHGCCSLSTSSQQGPLWGLISSLAPSPTVTMSFPLEPEFCLVSLTLLLPTAAAPGSAAGKVLFALNVHIPGGAQKVP